MKFFLLLLSLSFITSCATPTPFIELNGSATLNPEYVKEKLLARRPDFRECLMKGLTIKEEVTLKMVMKFSILANGNISTPEVITEDVKSLASIECLKNVLKAIHYPTTGNGEILDIVQPLNLYLKKNY